MSDLRSSSPEDRSLSSDDRHSSATSGSTLHAARSSASRAPPAWAAAEKLSNALAANVMSPPAAASAAKNRSGCSQVPSPSWALKGESRASTAINLHRRVLEGIGYVNYRHHKRLQPGAEFEMCFEGRILRELCHQSASAVTGRHWLRKPQPSQLVARCPVRAGLYRGNSARALPSICIKGTDKHDYVTLSDP